MTINKKRGRPSIPVKDQRTKIVQFRCTEKERKLLEKTAKSKGLSLSDWLRDTVLKKAQ